MQDTIDKMVRDFTQVTPRSKSEVRSRIEKLLLLNLADTEIKEWQAFKDKLNS